MLNHKGQKQTYELRGAFNKFQDYVLNTTTVNHTFLTVTFQHIFPAVHCNVPVVLQVGWKSSFKGSFIPADITGSTVCRTATAMGHGAATVRPGMPACERTGTEPAHGWFPVTKTYQTTNTTITTTTTTTTATTTSGVTSDFGPPARKSSRALSPFCPHFQAASPSALTLGLCCFPLSFLSLCFSSYFPFPYNYALLMQLGGLGSAVSSPRKVQGGALAANVF